MTDETEVETESGVLGSKARIKATKPRRPSRAPGLTDDEIKRIFDTAAKADTERLLADFETELDAVLRPGLERHYAAQLLARQQVTPELLKAHARLFKEFAREMKEVGVRALPTRSTFVASFLHVSRTNGADEDSLKAMASAISYAHRLKGLTDPTGDPLVDAVLAARPHVAAEKTNGRLADAEEVATQ